MSPNARHARNQDTHGGKIPGTYPNKVILNTAFLAQVILNTAFLAQVILITENSPIFGLFR